MEQTVELSPARERRLGKGQGFKQRDLYNMVNCLGTRILKQHPCPFADVIQPQTLRAGMLF